MNVPVKKYTSRKGEQGQSLPLLALGLVGIVALLTLSIDVGRVVHSRTDQQKVADAAALAGAQELAQVMPNTSAARSVAANYISANGGATCGGGCITFSQTNVPNDTITVSISRQVTHSFAQLVGLTSATITARAEVVVTVLTGLQFDEVDIFPYAVWGGERTTADNGCAYQMCVGSTQVYRSNAWVDDSNATGPGEQINGNNFKGYFHAGTEIVEINPTTWQTFSKGGNAVGQQPIDALDRHVANGRPIVVPVVEAARCTGGCGNIDFKIVAWVALKISDVGNPSQPWTGEVVANYTVPQGTSGGSSPPSSFPAVRTIRLVE